MEFVDLKSQYHRLREPINSGIQAVLEHGRYVHGAEIGELEAKLADYVGVNHCVALSSGTDALLISLMALDVGPGDEVVTSPFTFIATAETILLRGARPVFVDIDARTYNLDAGRLEPAVSSRTKAILPVSLYGQCADMDAINEVAARHGVPVIEDAAQSFGAEYKGRKSGSLSSIAATSFFPSKPLGCYGDGGALLTDDAGFAKVFAQLRDHGEESRYRHVRVGINGRMDSIQAAVLLAKFDSFPDEVIVRERIGARYTSLIEAAAAERGIAGTVVTPYIEPHNSPVYAQYTVEVPDRASVQAALQARGIPTAVHYPVPLHRQPVLESLGQLEGAFPVSEAAAARVISLPMHPYLDEDEQASVVTSLMDAVCA